jgi:Vacuolar protein sorting-associated protein 62
VPTGPPAKRPRGYSFSVLATAASALLIAFTPVVVHDSAERFPLTSVAAGAPAAYGHAVPARGGGRWLQYWLFSAYQDQDRGIVRTGRHTGDWETVQYRVDDRGRLLEAVYAQHSGAERCGAATVEVRSGHPVVYAAHGSHASYFHAGTRDRTWPDPNDEADGHGPVVRPRLVVVTRVSPGWMTNARPWGPTRASPIPGEQDSPRGPAFQPDRWDANAFAAAAHPCHAGCDHVNECDARENLVGAGVVALPLALVLLLRQRRRPRGDATG